MRSIGVLIAFIQTAFAVVHFLSPDELQYTFGVRSSLEIPKHRQISPKLIWHSNGKPKELHINLDGEDHIFELKSVTEELVASRVAVVHRERADGGGRLEFHQNPDDCHYHSESNSSFGAISSCDGTLKGTLITSKGVFVLHPLPEKHLNRLKRSATDLGPHIVYKRESENKEDFCGIDNVITSAELEEDEAGVGEDVFVTGQRLVQDGEKLVVELAIFVDELLWRHFSSQYGGAAWQKLQQYAVTMLNNIQIMYKQPSAVPQLYFRIVRYEVFKTQPSAMAPHLHSHGHAQQYLDRFCRYQKSLGVRDWDHALLLTGYDIHRGSGSRSISGIARLDGMCDVYNTCTLAEGLDFTSAFIGTHELGHSLGMRHDEPYCASTFIMSSSLGPGKVTWSTCSLRDYHTFIQRLDARGKNCLRTTLLSEKVPLTDIIKPGQLYDSNKQCMLMHGPGFQQITPRHDHYDGICYMTWCGQTVFGRIVTSHPALEGTFCGPNKWCQLGRCVAWSAPSVPLPPLIPVTTQSPITTNSRLPIALAATTTVVPITITTITSPTPSRVDGQWSQWTPFVCTQCQCPPIVGSIGVSLARRSCTNPSPANGGTDCIGSTQRAAVCSRSCPQQTLSVDQFISNKCTEHKRIKVDADLTGFGTQLTRFPQRACKIFCDVKNAFGGQRNYRFYGDNLPDGTSCGIDRYCLGGECLELSCQNMALIGRDLSCPTESCPITATPPPPSAGIWGVWSLWSSCSVSCGGGGLQVRSRVCSIPNRCEGQSTERIACGEQACPIPRHTTAQWTEWTQWNQCSVSCGRGSQARYRKCVTSQNTLATTCIGQTMDIRICDEIPCPTAVPSTTGIWANWGVWTTCSATCGPGVQSRSRVCTQEPCVGLGQQRINCNLKECTNQWALWGEWSDCSRMCGRGIRSRSRGCSVAGGCVGSNVEQSYCNESPCMETNGEWSLWSEWGPCSVTCGRGVKRRTRHCQSGNCPGLFRESALCTEPNCVASNAEWGGWGYWSSCSETCGTGFRRRIRKCYGSGSCAGEEFERENCSIKPCS